MTQPSANGSSQIEPAKISDRHPALEGREDTATFALQAVQVPERHVPQTVHEAQKADLAVERSSCAGQTWPRIDASCLQAAEGGDTPRVIRTVAIEDRLGENTSVVMRTASTVTAAR
ncbi:hypothetical protein [Lutibaculum baratangense]|uniref:Uncharacterized protein n=1 Tax=Lutibaculum baratangense AMV1 TaxID=631454 RepID=V4RH28_9HYPH|nr:hypothetical protein [Lutibaculum baratangense]ESR22595.1 hypothetical protein N177_3731 [Lutibaculum baratangense AMV1]